MADKINLIVVTKEPEKKPNKKTKQKKPKPQKETWEGSPSDLIRRYTSQWGLPKGFGIRKEVKK